MTDTNSEQFPGSVFLCYAWGETDLPVAKFARSREEVLQFMQDEWFGEKPETMHPDNLANWTSAVAEFDAPEWDLRDSVQWEFEIGGVRITRVFISGERVGSPVGDSGKDAQPERHPCEAQATDAVVDDLLAARDQCIAAGLTNAADAIKAAVLYWLPENEAREWLDAAIATSPAGRAG